MNKLKIFNEKLEEQTKAIYELKGSFSIIKPVGVVIAGGVVVAVLKYLFFP